MKRFILLLVIILLCGCSPQRRLANLLERFPIPADTVIQIHTVYESDTIEVLIPGDSVFKEVEIEVPIDLPDTTIYSETAFAQAMAGLLSNNLWLLLVQKDTIIPIKVDSVFVTVYEDREITKTVVVDNTKPFYKSGFFILAGIIVLGLLFFFLFRRR